MTLYERITGGVSESLKKAYGRADFIVDIPKTNVGFDLYSNILKITGKEIQINDFDGFVEKISFENGFLNIRLKEEVLIEFLFDFEPSISETDSDVDRMLQAYIQLAENEKKFSEIRDISMPLTSEVRRVILFLMKLQYLYSIDTKKGDIIKSEVIGLLDKIKSTCENLKAFVITYEPLLIAVRGSLAKF